MSKVKSKKRFLKKKLIPPLFIGRFQPFHLGHLDVIKQILKKYRRVIIGIGSAQYNKQPRNPYSAAARAKMIQAGLCANGIPKRKFTLVKIPDIHNDTNWVAHVSRFCPPFGEVWSGTPKVQKLFREEKKHTVIKPKFNLAISATDIRKRMRSNKPWRHLVPYSVFYFIHNTKQS